MQLHTMEVLPRVCILASVVTELLICYFDSHGTIWRPSVCPSIHPSINFFLFIASSPRPLVRFFFETCLGCFSCGQAVLAQIWFRSIYKYGRRQPSLIFTVIALAAKPVEEFYRNLAHAFLTMSRCVCPKTISVHLQIWLSGGHKILKSPISFYLIL